MGHSEEKTCVTLKVTPTNSGPHAQHVRPTVIISWWSAGPIWPVSSLH